MVTLYSLPGAGGLPSASPFCAKLETWLRMADIPYETVFDPMKRGKKGKFPWVQLDDGTQLCDSSDIVDALTERFDVKLDADLTPAQRAQAHLLQRTCEEHLYFVILYHRWVDADGWKETRPKYFKGMPPVVDQIVPAMLRNGVKKSLQGQGLGRHSRAEVMARGVADVDALAVLLGDRPWFLGDEPHGIDATLHAWLTGLTRGPASEVGDAVRGHENLMAYVQRGLDRWWPEDD